MDDVRLNREERGVVANWVESTIPMAGRVIEWFELDFEGADPVKARTLLRKLGVLDTVLARSAAQYRADRMTSKSRPSAVHLRSCPSHCPTCGGRAGVLSSHE